MTAKEQIVERMLAARKLAMQYQAEANGLLCALVSVETPARMFSDEDLQRAFLRGFLEGRTIVDVESRAAEIGWECDGKGVRARR